MDRIILVSFFWVTMAILAGDPRAAKAETQVPNLIFQIGDSYPNQIQSWMNLGTNLSNGVAPFTVLANEVKAIQQFKTPGNTVYALISSCDFYPSRADLTPAQQLALQQHHAGLNAVLRYLKRKKLPVFLDVITSSNFTSDGGCGAVDWRHGLILDPTKTTWDQTATTTDLIYYVHWYPNIVGLRIQESGHSTEAGVFGDFYIPGFTKTNPTTISKVVAFAAAQSPVLPVLVVDTVWNDPGVLGSHTAGINDKVPTETFNGKTFPNPYPPTQTETDFDWVNLWKADIENISASYPAGIVVPAWETNDGTWLSATKANGWYQWISGGDQSPTYGTNKFVPGKNITKYGISIQAWATGAPYIAQGEASLSPIPSELQTKIGDWTTWMNSAIANNVAYAQFEPDGYYLNVDVAVNSSVLTNATSMSATKMGGLNATGCAFLKTINPSAIRPDNEVTKGCGGPSMYANVQAYDGTSYVQVANNSVIYTPLNTASNFAWVCPANTKSTYYWGSTDQTLWYQGVAQPTDPAGVIPVPAQTANHVVIFSIGCFTGPNGTGTQYNGTIYQIVHSD